MRERFVHAVSAQINLLNNTDPEAKGRRWFQEVDGKYRFSFRYRNSPIEFDDKAFFEVNTREAVAKTFRAAIKEIQGGEWDELLAEKQKTMKRAGKKKAAVVV